MTKVFELNSNKDEQRMIKKTPAVTSVAACISADTGVGPSIASGNQMCRPICADLPTAPKNSKKVITDKRSIVIPKIVQSKSTALGAKAKTTWYSTVLKVKNTSAIANANPTSPTRLTIIAFIAALPVLILLNQKLISKKDAKPIPSQPKNMMTKLSAVTSSNIKKVNKDK